MIMHYWPNRSQVKKHANICVHFEKLQNRLVIWTTRRKDLPEHLMRIVCRVTCTVLLFQPSADPSEHPLHHCDRVWYPPAEGGHPGEDPTAVLQLLEAGREGSQELLPHPGRGQEDR